MIRVGFTGTQIGCTSAQAAALHDMLLRLEGSTEPYGVLHHGDCVGADAEAHETARSLAWRVELHPPRVSAKRALCEMLDGEVTHAPLDYLVRNRAIVDSTSVLVACPREETGEELRSGTWATVRYARKLGRPVYIVRPSGRVEEERVS